jgi:chromosome segregation ATPase
MDLESMAAGGGVVGALGVLVGGIVKLFGTRQERSADMEAAAEEWRSLAQASRAAEAECMRRAAETQEQVEQLREAMREQRDEWSQRFHVIESEHSKCPPRIRDLEITVNRLTMQSTPPMGIDPNELRAAMADEETGP